MTSTAQTPGPSLPSCPPSAPSLLLPTFPGAALLVTTPDAPGSKLIIKLKREGPLVGNTEEMPRTQTFFLTGMPIGWTTQRRDGPPGPGIRTVLLTKAGEEPGGRKPRVPEALPSVRAPPPSDSSFACTSKGVYENYRRWQRYKALARHHFSATPDAEALACFFIPVLRSLARLRPDMTLEDGVPRAVQEWEHSSNFERMIFYEMAEKFMEFEAEEEQQIQKMKLLTSCSQFQPPVPKPTKLPVSPSPESGQQQVYIPKKSANKSRQPRRRQRRPPSTSIPGAPKEIPAEAVHQYAEIMEGLETAWEEEEEEKKEPGASKDPQGQEDGIFPDPSLLQYIDRLCDDEEFICKAEAVIHPQFMAHLLSPGKSQDPLDLLEELEEELHLTPSQLMEKRLLALTEEEKDPSVYPTSHSDSTPSLSEEEDEASGHGKGGGPLCRSTKRPFLNKGFRTCQTELPPPVSRSPQPSYLYPQLGDRRLPSKGVRTESRPSPHTCSSSNTQDITLLPPLKNTIEEETQNTQAGGHTIETLAHTQCIQLNATLDITGNNTFTSLTSQGRIESRQEIVRLPTMEHSKQSDTQERKAMVQEEILKATEQGNHTLNRTQLLRNSLQSAHNKCRKQDGIQPREAKCLKKAQTMWIDGPKEMDQSRDVNKIVLVEPTVGQRAQKLMLNGHGELNIDPPEKIRGQVHVQERKGSEAIPNKAPLDSQDREITSHWDSHIKPGSSEVTLFKCEKEYGRQREEVNDQYRFQSIRIGTQCNPVVPAAQIGNVNPCGQILSRHSSLTLATFGTGNKLSDQIANAVSQKHSQVDQKRNKATIVKDNSPVKSTKLPAGKIPLQKQLSPARQDDQPSADLPFLETDPKANLKANVESSRRSGQQLVLFDPSGIGVLKYQPPGVDLEQLSCSSFSVLESPSSRIQTGLEGSQKSQQLLTDQRTVTHSMEAFPDAKQTLNPALVPSSFVLIVEASGGSCGQSGDHISGPNSPNKVIPAQLIPQEGSCNSSQNNKEPNNLHPSEVHGSCCDMKILSELEARSLLENVPVANVRSPDLTEAGLEEILKHSAKDKKEEEEDEELSSFSSLLATKLSLSPYHNYGLLPMDQGDTQLSFPTETGQRGAKMRPSTKGKMPQGTAALPNKKLEANPTTHRCCPKRKNSSSGTRRSKRLRNQ